MKKVLYSLLSVLVLIGITSCDNVTEESIIGKWKMKTIQTDQETIEDDGQVWEFTSDHKLYLSWPKGSLEDEHPAEYAGKWSLEGKQLSTEFWPMPFTVAKLTSTTLIVELSAKGEFVRYTFIKLKE